MNRRRLIAFGMSCLASTALAPLSGFAQSHYPDRPIRLIVPFAAGGVVDVIGRLWAERMTPLLGTIVIENLGGGGGTVGAAEAARAQPDGYTMLLGNTSTQVLNPAVMPKAPYDPAKAFRTISILANSANAFAVHSSVPARTLGELIAYIKSHPGQVSYGSPGAGTLTHLTGEMFKQFAGLPDLVHVPYRGAGPGINDLVSGHIPLMLLNITGQVLQLHRNGNIRIIAVCSPTRLAALPEVPTAAETVPNLIAQLFTGLFVPAGTSATVIEQVARANRAAMASDDLKKKLVEAGLDPMLDTPVEAQRFVDQELERLVPVIKATGFKA